MSTMKSVIFKKIHSWDLTKSAYSEIDELPLMSSPGPILVLLAAYLLFVLKVGPNYMTKKKAYQLRSTLLIYNAFQVALSAYMVNRYLNMLFEFGLFPRTCLLDNDYARREVIVGMWIYCAAKVSELLDTVFFVLRKKDNQVTFLHLYHHSIMFAGTWAMLKFAPSHNLIFIGFLNSLVHVVMYSYYGLAALGPGVAKYLTWKKYMTTFQLGQFVCVIIQYVGSVLISDCPPSKGIACFIAGNTGFFLFLFLNFYRQSYIKKGEKRPLKSEKDIPNQKDVIVNGKEHGRYTNGINKEKIK